MQQDSNSQNVVSDDTFASVMFFVMQPADQTGLASLSVRLIGSCPCEILPALASPSVRALCLLTGECCMRLSASLIIRWILLVVLQRIHIKASLSQHLGTKNINKQNTRANFRRDSRA